jgi:hypothetical protein
MSYTMRRPMPRGLPARRLLSILLVALLALGGISPGRAEAAPPTPSVTAQALGNSVYVHVHSSVPVAWEIQFSETRAPTGSPPSFGSIVVSKASSNGVHQTTFAHLFNRRTPGKTHWYIVKATDASGQSSYRTGEVRTNNRGLTVTYQRIRDQVTEGQ